MSTAQSSGNQFLFGMSPDDYSMLRNRLVLKDLHIGDMLQRCGDRTSEVVFLHSGVAVMRARQRAGAGTGIALIGRDGIVGGFAVHAALPATCDCEILIGGKASHMPASAFREALDRSSRLRQWASQFDNALMAQIQQTALCNATHSVEARMCRWLLEVQDRSDSDRVPLTQGALAELLGVRRTTVTLAAGQLEAKGAIDCRRGYMRLIDRAALERCCCECFGRMTNNGVRLATPHDETFIVAARVLSSSH